MINANELMQIILNGESDRVERTLSTNDTEKFSKVVCAFANDLPNHKRPGYLCIGVEDNGKIIGADVTDQLLQTLGAIRSNGNIQPLPAISVEKIRLEDKDIAVVEVLPSDLPPVRYNGRVWIRVGPRKAIASEQEERILTERRIAHVTSYDSTSVKGASLADLSTAQFTTYRQSVISADIIEANHRTIEEQLASLRFYDIRQNCPTLAGLLLFGINTRFFLPGAYVQYLRFSGTTLTDTPVDQAEVSGDLLNVLLALDLRIKTNVTTTLRQMSPLREAATPDYPDIAIREILLNAIMHRDYASNTPVHFYWFADRIEILSPGGLYGEVTKESLMTRSSYRNPVIAEAMKALGYVNRFGYGIQRAQAALKNNGNPEAVYEIDDRSVLAIIRRRPQ